MRKTNVVENNTAPDAINTSGAAPETTAQVSPAAPETPAEASPAAPEANNASPEANNATTQPPALSTSSYVMSIKAKDLQTRRKALFKNMQDEYKKVFGDDKKAPKAKMYHAAGLLTIRERDGEEAYAKKLQEYIEANQGKYSNKTQKKSAPFTSVAVPNKSSSTAAGSQIITTIETIAANIKGMIDTMVSTTKTLVQSDGKNMEEIAEKVVHFANTAAAQTANTAKTANTTHKKRKQRSNKGKTHSRHQTQETAEI